MNTTRTAIATAIMAVAISAPVASAATHLTSNSPDHPTVVYEQVRSNHATATTKIKVRGKGCMEAEDSSILRLVRYVPNRDLAVYRCGGF